MSNTHQPQIAPSAPCNLRQLVFNLMIDLTSMSSSSSSSCEGHSTAEEVFAGITVLLWNVVSDASCPKIHILLVKRTRAIYILMPKPDLALAKRSNL